MSTFLWISSMMSAISVILSVIFKVLQFVYTKILKFWYGGPSKTTATTKNYILLESATSLANRIRNRKATSTEIIESFIDRIREINDVLNCVVDERFDEALKEAKRVDDLIKSGEKTKEELESETPFLGVPFTTQESIAIKGLSHSGGIWDRKGVRADEDARVVALLRKAGAIPLACTNVSEACLSAETNNPIFGRTLNPYHTGRTVGGSSGGQACTVAACGSPMGVGCDTNGSLRLSSSFTGVFCHKLSANVCPLEGLFPEATNSTTSLGPVSKSSEDLIPILKVMLQDSKTDLMLDQPVDISKLKYYIVKTDDGGWFTSPIDTEIKEAIEKAENHLKNSLKARVERVDIKELKNSFFLWMAKKENGRRTAERAFAKGGSFRAGRELFKALWGDSHHSVIFLLSLLIEERIELLNRSNIKKFEEEYRQLSKELENLLGKDGVLIYPSQPTPAFFHNESLTKNFNLGYASIFNSLGLPATHCPTGLDADNLPTGLQVVAGAGMDRLTLAVAREVDRVLGGWKPPPTHGTFTLKSAVLQKSNGISNSL